MDLKSIHASSVLTEPIPIKSRLGIPSSLLTYSSSATNSYPSVPSLVIPRKKPGKLDGIRASWFDAMQSSSPPRKKLNKEFLADDTTNDIDSYSYWLSKHPSALKSFEDITFQSKGKQIALFLDYDGTLSPIVDDPDNAIMSVAMRDVVRNVAKHFPTAIISGRSRDKVFEFVKLTELYYAGSHGMDIMGPATHSVDVNGYLDSIRSTDGLGKEVTLFQPASEFLPMIDEVFKSLIESTKEIKGSKVESNKFCVSVHYRNVEKKYWVPIEQIVNDIMKAYPRLRLTHGRKVLEVRPVIDWNKGKAMEFLLESLGFGDSNDVFPIYVGDDLTDEDAFKVLRDGNKGRGILVSDMPKETNAFYSVKDPSEVMEFLSSLVRWKRSAEGA